MRVSNMQGWDDSFLFPTYFSHSLLSRSAVSLSLVQRYLIYLKNYIPDCDNIIHSPGAPANAADCNMHCTGNAAEFCGAGDRINIYSK